MFYRIKSLKKKSSNISKCYIVANLPMTLIKNIKKIFLKMITPSDIVFTLKFMTKSTFLQF